MTQLLAPAELMSVGACTCADLLMSGELGVTGTICHTWQVSKQVSHLSTNFEVEVVMIAANLIIPSAVSRFLFDNMATSCIATK